ncbi:MAG: GDP-L-fucose synthase [Pseudomonadota bacterium]
MQRARVFALSGKKIFIAGHRGMVGSAVCRRLAREECEIITADRQKIDLRRQEAVEAFFEKNEIDAVVMCAAKVGGILANDTAPATFLYDNLLLQTNIIHSAHLANVERFVFLGSTCVYPKLAPQPISEDALLSGPLEPTNQWYAIAKIAGIKMCDAYRRQYERSYVSVMPTNLYGPNDNFDLATSHVLPALMRKIDEAKRKGAPHVEIWGDGSPLREFMHVDDLADALTYVLQYYDEEGPINAGTGEEVSIRSLAEMISDVVGYSGAFVFDETKPNGTPRKVSDVTKLRGLGWRSSMSLSDGLRAVYKWYLENETHHDFA